MSFPSQNKKDLKILSKSNLEIYLGDIIINSKKILNRCITWLCPINSVNPPGGRHKIGRGHRLRGRVLYELQTSRLPSLLPAGPRDHMGPRRQTNFVPPGFLFKLVLTDHRGGTAQNSQLQSCGSYDRFRQMSSGSRKTCRDWWQQ